MESADMRKQSRPTATPPPIAASTPPPPAAAAPNAAEICFAYLARLAFLILAALMSASFFVEPFAMAAADLRLPWPAAVAVIIFLASSFCASVHLFCSFFLTRPPPAAAAVAAPLQGQGVGVIAIASVGIGVAACLVAASGSAYGYAFYSQLELDNIQWTRRTRDGNRFGGRNMTYTAFICETGKPVEYFICRSVAVEGIPCAYWITNCETLVVELDMGPPSSGASFFG
ncbi:hypothetical protein EJB05_43224, partial [Eragrostis curvula]